MKRIIILLLSLTIGLTASAQPNQGEKQGAAEQNAQAKPAEKEMVMQEYLLPKFKKEWFFQKYRDWVIDNIVYPQSCIDERIEGRVVVNFVIDADGMIRIAEASQTPDKRLSDELIRVLKSEKWYAPAKKWDPLRKKYNAIPMRSMIPINFNLPPKQKVNNDHLRYEMMERDFMGL